jgi:hypothetical protein
MRPCSSRNSLKRGNCSGANRSAATHLNGREPEFERGGQLVMTLTVGQAVLARRAVRLAAVLACHLGTLTGDTIRDESPPAALLGLGQRVAQQIGEPGEA